MEKSNYSRLIAIALLLFAFSPTLLAQGGPNAVMGSSYPRTKSMTDNEALRSTLFVLRGNAVHAAAITKSDSADLSNYSTQGIYVGGTGDIKVDMVSGGTVTFSSVPVGILQIQAKKVYSTGTTATNLITLY